MVKIPAQIPLVWSSATVHLKKIRSDGRSAIFERFKPPHTSAPRPFAMTIPPAIRTALATASWFPLVYIFFNHAYQPAQIQGSSMAPALNPSTSTTTRDVVVVQKFGVKQPGSLKKGDVVMFRSPLDPEKLVTKRVVAVQGESVRTSDPYPRPEARVPRNHLWVEGDNRFHLIDLNNFGPISQALVTGKVVYVCWPLSRMGAVARYG